MAAEQVAVMLRMDRVTPDPDQPRKVFRFRPLRELYRSIKANGLKDPIHVKPGTNGVHLIVDGERRWRCMRALRAGDIRAFLMPSDTDTLVYGLITLLNREGLSVMEAAWAYKRLIDAGMSQTDVARKVGKHQPEVSSTLALLNLPADLQQTVAYGRLAASSALLLVRRCRDAAHMRATWEEFRRKKAYSPGKLTVVALKNFLDDRDRLARLQSSEGLDPLFVVRQETAANVLPAAQRLLGVLERLVGDDSEEGRRQFLAAWDSLGPRTKGELLKALRAVNSQTRLLTERLQNAKRPAAQSGGE